MGYGDGWYSHLRRYHEQQPYIVSVDQWDDDNLGSLERDGCEHRKILWQTADPAEAMDLGSVSVANGVVYAPSISGNMHALDATTGKILWTFASGGSVVDGPAIVNGMVFWGSGYANTTGGVANNKVFAFGIGK